MKSFIVERLRPGAGARACWRISARFMPIAANSRKPKPYMRNVLRLNPDYPIARSNLAEVLLREGHKKEAEELLASTTKATETTRKEYPRTWVAVLNFALSYHREKNDTEALAIAEKARHDYPGVWEIIRFEADVLRQTRGRTLAFPWLKLLCTTTGGIMERRSPWAGFMQRRAMCHAPRPHFATPVGWTCMMPKLSV